MAKAISLFKQQIKEFSQKNWWVFLIFLSSLLVIFITKRGDAIEVGLIFALHFTADILIMMMAYEYSKGKYRTGTRYQILAAVIFIIVKIYTGYSNNNWQYLSAELIYILAGIKNYWRDARKYTIKWINYKTTSLLSIIILSSIYVPLNLIKSTPQWIQTIGIFVFAIALSTTESEKLRYILSILGLAAMVGGSFWETLNTFLTGDIVGLAFSYFLLPLAVLVIYIKLWRNYMFRPKKVGVTHENS